MSPFSGILLWPGSGPLSQSLPHWHRASGSPLPSCELPRAGLTPHPGSLQSGAAFAVPGSPCQMPADEWWWGFRGETMLLPGEQVHTLTPRISTLAPRGKACRALPCPASLSSLLPGRTLVFTWAVHRLGPLLPPTSPGSGCLQFSVSCHLFQAALFVPRLPTLLSIPASYRQHGNVLICPLCALISPMLSIGSGREWVWNRFWMPQGMEEPLSPLVLPGQVLAEGWRTCDLLIPQGTGSPASRLCGGGAEKAKSHLCCPQLSYVALTYRGHRPIIWDQISQRLPRRPARAARIPAHPLWAHHACVRKTATPRRSGKQTHGQPMGAGQRHPRGPHLQGQCQTTYMGLLWAQSPFSSSLVWIRTQAAASQMQNRDG